MQAPLIRVDFKCSKSIIDDCSDSYYNRYYYDAYLVSDRLEILPEFRHKGYGQIIRQIKRSFFNGSYGIEVLHSFPLQLELFDNDKDDWRAKQQYDSMEHDSKKAFASLNRCYKKDGYKRYKRTEYFYRQP